ncbi:hypothetical protein [Niabella aquatica]
MKMIIVVIAICFLTAINAQNRALLYIKPKTDYNDSIPNNAAWIDTTNMYSSKYGKVARLTQDNMPCIIPYNATKHMPNAFNKNQPLPNEIPNAWKRDSVKGK